MAGGYAQGRWRAIVKGMGIEILQAGLGLGAVLPLATATAVKEDLLSQSHLFWGKETTSVPAAKRI